MTLPQTVWLKATEMYDLSLERNFGNEEVGKADSLEG